MTINQLNSFQPNPMMGATALSTSGASSAKADVFTDLTGLQDIKLLGKGNTNERQQALESIAKQFESVFLGMMMKSMREANSAFEDKEMSGSNEMKFYQQMFDQQLTLSLSNQGIGIADAMVRQLSQGMSVEAPVTEPDDMDFSQYIMDLKAVLESESGLVSKRADDVSLDSPPAQGDQKQRESSVPASLQAEEPAEAITIRSLEDFKRHLLPLAEKAAEVLGVDARFLLSQAALETGWGKHMIKDQAGRNSYNLFGIKASQSWDGNTAVVSTLEYQDGIPKREKASFRAYGSYEESFRDYVSFIKNQDRYQSAVKSASDPEAYVNELQRAGYATDPKYAEKIRSIVNQHFVGESGKGRG